MTARKYSVEEIARMRLALRHHRDTTAFAGAYAAMSSLTYNAMFEDMLRTYMANGTEPRELDGIPDEVARSA